MPVVEPDEPLDRPVEEGPVMADHDECSRPVVEELLQGPESVEIEIVRRLVEEQHVRPVGQHE